MEGNLCERCLKDEEECICEERKRQKVLLCLGLASIGIGIGGFIIASII